MIKENHFKKTRPKYIINVLWSCLVERTEKMSNLIVSELEKLNSVL